MCGSPSDNLRNLHQVSGGCSTLDFFKDSPWLAIPKERRGEIIMESLYPRWGLLGGTSKQDAAPKSKLAALAAARKKKENQKPGDEQTVASSVSLLDKLGKSPEITKLVKGLGPSAPGIRSETDASTANAAIGRYPKRKSKTIEPLPEKQPTKFLSVAASSPPTVATANPPKIMAAATPSRFALSILGLLTDAGEPDNRSIDHTTMRAFVNPTEFDFAGPSPDDVVLEAQNSKGQASKAAKQKPPLTKAQSPDDDVIEGLNEINIDQRVKGRYLDVLAEFAKSKPKNSANFVVIGPSMFLNP